MTTATVVDMTHTAMIGIDRDGAGEPRAADQSGDPIMMAGIGGRAIVSALTRRGDDVEEPSAIMHTHAHAVTPPSLRGRGEVGAKVTEQNRILDRGEAADSHRGS